MVLRANLISITCSNLNKLNRISSLSVKLNNVFSCVRFFVVHRFFAIEYSTLLSLGLRTFLLSLVLLISACGGVSNRAPVTDLSEGAGSTYKVRAGDTLYAISWRYGFDYRQLAKTNDISPPYRLVPGQVLLLKNPGQVTAGDYSKQKNANNSYANNSNNVASTRVTNNKNSINSSKNTTVSSTQSASSTAFSGRWQWPANGAIVKRYTTSGSPHKGIDIDGKLGEPVYAAAAGEVVYAGNGLVGYGNLLILRHDDNYLSAYGHNSVLLVREGNVVKAGQRIAEMGDSGTNSVKLHFEIRYDGKPVDPVGFLPKR